MPRDHSFSDHFSNQASAYATYRPAYPDALADFLADHAPRTDTAWDAGCGSGQLATLLAHRFAHVHATDASAAQLAHATPHPRVTYHQALAESSALPDDSIDLCAAAQAAHWFALPAWYDEIRRVARDQALVALVSYGLPRVDDDVDAAVDRLHGETLAPFWPPERRHVDAAYATLPFPFDEIDAPPFASSRRMSPDQLIGYVETWSALRPLAPAQRDELLAPFRDELARAWQDGEERVVTWPVRVRAGVVR